MGIEDMFEDFCVSLEDSNAILQQMLDVIAEGRVPAKEDMEQLNSIVNSLRQRYIDIRDEAERLLPGDELPEEGAPAISYIEAVANSTAARLAEMRSALEQFVSVQAIAELYAKKLKPYQDKALQLLMDEKADTDIDTLSVETEGPRLFLQALMLENLDTEEGNTLLDLVDLYYPPTITRGLAARKFYLRENKNEESQQNAGAQHDISIGDIDAAGTDTARIADDKLNIEPSVPLVDNMPLHENPENEILAEDDCEPVEANPENEIENQTDFENKGTIEAELDELTSGTSQDADDNQGELSVEAEPSEFALRVRDSGLLLENTDAIGELTVEKSRNEGRKVSASIFKSEIPFNSATPLKYAAQYALKYPAFSESMLMCMLKIPQGHIQTALGRLMKHGYLRKYTVADHGSFYCASPRLCQVVAQKSIADQLGVRKGKTARDGAVGIEDKNTSAANRLTYTKLLCDIIGHLRDVGITSSRQEDSMGDDGFTCAVFPGNGTMECELVISAFWDEIEECDVFLQRIRKNAEQGWNINHIIFAGFDREKAKILAELVLPEMNLGEQSPIIELYSFVDDTRYSYPDGNPIQLNTDGAAESEAVKEEAAENQAVKDEMSAEAPQTELIAENDDVSAMVHESADTTESNLETDETAVSEAVADTVDTVVVPEVSAKSASVYEEVNTGIENKIYPPVEYTAMPVAEPLSEVELTDFKEHTTKLILDDRIYAATAFARAFAVYHPEVKPFYDQLAYAVNDPMQQSTYSASVAFTLMDGDDELSDAMIISGALRLFFSNQVSYDYNIRSYYGGISKKPLLTRYPELNKALYTIMKFKDEQHKGMDAYADYRSKDDEKLQQKKHKIQQEAKDFYDNYVLGRKSETACQKRFLLTKEMMFNKESELGITLQAIVEGETEYRTIALDFLKENFFREDSNVSADSIDNYRLWTYIVQYWEKAGELMIPRKHEKLMSSLRTNIVNLTTKAVRIIADWCDVVDGIGNMVEDESKLEYKKLHKNLLADLQKAAQNLEVDSRNASGKNAAKAGLRLLADTVWEIATCMDGSYDGARHRYFYQPLLLTDDVTLGEDWMPDFGMHGSTLGALLPMTRILNHAQKVKTQRPTCQERLKDILENKGDDYGSAKLLVEYMQYERGITPETLKAAENIEAGLVYARAAARKDWESFVGNLELAQSYGQIDNTNEDRKERILQTIGAWYEWAEETANYGFFRRVTQAYLEDIHEKARGHAQKLQRQLEDYKQRDIPGLSAEVKQVRIKRIQEMIEQQNYTVAEDMLRRFIMPEEEQDRNFEEDFLQDFLDNYEDCYRPVARNGRPLSLLLNTRARNKEARGANRLTENWLPGGSRMSTERLDNLLVSLGFHGVKASPVASIGKFERFHVKIAEAASLQADGKAQKAIYTHPVAAFGSGVMQEGFQVVCLNGTYNANGLIDVMKQIGNEKHTLILLDCALTLSERRRLARKSKNELDDRLMAVLDRTVMMYLFKNYDEMKINRMVVSLITPFGYYQPYVWDSAKIMPPEMFMGRKRELEQIENPNGVNLVYGGRQLGKSALLKKARADKDFDEAGDRAVLVDIKGLDYKQAAKKIGHELYDLKVLEEDIDTEDWNVLARAIKNRLRSANDYIPYLLMLMDEGDVFIESCAEVNYAPFDALKDIQSIGERRFKFVIAGLRNVARFKHEALEANSVVPHLRFMTVKPFNTTEARELLELPLHYLGLRFPKDKQYLVSLILANTNYFPGLIQLYCSKLIEAMRSDDYAGYNEVDAPIYEVSEEHIKKVLADPEFTRQIREKYIITLKLDEDNYYYLIALMMAYLTNNEKDREGSNGYSAENLQELSRELEIRKIAGMELSKLEALLEELNDLNVLRSTDKSHYLFTRTTFCQMMGTQMEVEDKLNEYMGE